MLFPVTMISKRLERGVPFRIEELYQKGIDAIRGQVPDETRPPRPPPPKRPVMEGA